VAARDDIETKLIAARTWLIIDKPFLGALVMRLPLAEADPSWCATTATDARAFYYNRAYIAALSFEQTKFVLAHEALHCALSHFARRDHRHKRRWDIACDLAINPLLVADGLQAPPGALMHDEFKGMTAEEIYPCIRENAEEETLDRHLYDETNESQGTRDRPAGGGAGQGEPREGGGRTPQAQPDEDARGAQPPPPLTAPEREQLKVQWQQRLAGAAQSAMQAGRFGGSLARLVDHLLQPRLPWRVLLARYLTATARQDYNFARPSRREGAAILPGLKSSHIDLVIALDTSGSISNEELREFATEINALKGQTGARIRLLACDERLAPEGPWHFEPWEELVVPSRFQGGGGTRFTPVFEWVENQDRRPDLLVYFTDAEGEFPPSEPSYPVLWLVKGQAKVPWGQRIQLN
jgi:predicted metal-dependent peptidase